MSHEPEEIAALVERLAKEWEKNRIPSVVVDLATITFSYLADLEQRLNHVISVTPYYTGPRREARESVDETFGQRLHSLRTAAGLSQRALADKVGCDFSYISKMENGRGEYLPSMALISALAEVLHADREELLALAGKIGYESFRQIVAAIPEVGILLNRLVAGKVSREQVQRFLAEIEGAGV